MRDLDRALLKTCGVYQVDPSWVRAIIATESGWDPYAIRYEPGYLYLLNPAKFASVARVTFSTEVATQKMSWGLGQIMGALAREQGHVGSMPELCLPGLNVKHLCIRIAQIKKRSLEASDVFAAYNGGLGALKKRDDGTFTNQAYVDRVLKNLSELE